MQFDTNSDYPSLPAVNPPEFPPAEPSPCARLTTRVYHPSKDIITMEADVLVRTRMPKRSSMRTTDDMGSSSSDESSYMSADDYEAPSQSQVEIVTGEEEECAYWMQRTIREAIYGRVLFAVVLKKRRVREAEWIATDEKCAIKEMSWQHIRKERDKLAEDPIKEVGAMQFLKRWYDAISSSTSGDSFVSIGATNVMMPMDLLSDDRYLYSVMPFCNGGELFEMLDMNEKFTEDEARHWMRQVLNGLETLQLAGICHRDISLENLLVHENGCLIIDMGMCLMVPTQRISDNEISTSFNCLDINSNPVSEPYSINARTSLRHLILPQGVCGKWLYMSPEIYKNREPFDGFAVDMWAAGVILFLMLTGFPPWERACDADERFKYMSSGYLVQMLTEWQLGLSSDAMDLLQRMLWLDPNDRLSLEQVRAHPWMQR
mmetsp:Transcript_20020/g.30105  ORF Transcript_20020/g.30105 Transcript_20020/m.30105 type:complete len:432 (+) Transcript_20020:175-1470(+)